MPPNDTLTPRLTMGTLDLCPVRLALGSCETRSRALDAWLQVCFEWRADPKIIAHGKFCPSSF